MSATPNQKYNSGNVPAFTFFVDIYRLTDPNDTTTGVKLGRYLVENLQPTEGATVMKRPNIDAGKNGWQIIGMDIEGSCTVQRNVTATPSVQNGDYMDAALFVNSAGTAVAQRFVFHGVASPVDQGYRKQNFNVIVDDAATNVVASDSYSKT